ncbi:hypothetical protein (nucleomorph) [Guillardia theta]|uniref:Uncharacterized protein n=1 Tax=Guillardia theta TaxID=55529 RepID=Q98RL0_GUITH|nr:hypothetical protein GTHECHR1145 [Guillardia theta]AAK39938.1 hypothetical protein [Guillardia theta]
MKKQKMTQIKYNYDSCVNKDISPEEIRIKKKKDICISDKLKLLIEKIYNLKFCKEKLLLKNSKQLVINDKNDIIIALNLNKDGLSVRNVLWSYENVKEDLMEMSLKNNNQRLILACKSKTDIKIFNFKMVHEKYNVREIIKNWYLVK